jgi:hypothetical protein
MTPDVDPGRYYESAKQYRDFLSIELLTEQETILDGRRPGPWRFHVQQERKW